MKTFERQAFSLFETAPGCRASSHSLYLHFTHFTCEVFDSLTMLITKPFTILSAQRESIFRVEKLTSN